MPNLFAFSYNGVHVGSPRYALTVTRSAFTRSARSAIDLQTTAQGKAWAGVRRKEPRTIGRQCTIQADDPTDLRAKFAALNLLLHQDDAEHRLVLDDQPGVFYNALSPGGITDEPYRFKSGFPLEFLCPDPCGYSETQTDISHTISATPTTVVFPTGGGAITGATNATPIVITSVAHGLSSGDTVPVTGVAGNTAANGTWVVLVLTADTFSLVGSVGNGTYTSGGTWTKALGGTAKAEPDWYLRNNTGATVTSAVTIENLGMSGDALTVALNWPTGYWIKAGGRDSHDRYRNTLKISTASGTDPLLLTFVDAISGWFSGLIPRLIPGAQNSVRVTGLSAATLRAIYRETYV